MSDNGYKDLLGPAGAREVTAPDGKVLLVISNLAEGIPAPVQVRAGASTGLIRFIGGASIEDAGNKRHMLAFMADACTGLRQKLMLLGAGNRVVAVTGDMPVLKAQEEQLRTNPMVMELPGLVQQQNPTCFTLGVVPRVGQTMSIYGKYSSFALDSEPGTDSLANPTYQMLWVVQRNASQQLGWEGDVNLTFDLIDAMRREGKPAAVVAWNGGRVTALEIRRALLDGVPLGVVRGSGRFVDDLIKWQVGRRQSVSSQGAAVLKQWEGVVPLTNVEILTNPSHMRGWLHEHSLTR